MTARSLFATIATTVTLTAAPVLAADMRMPVKAPPAPAVTMYSWTGCYIGGHVGGAFGRHKFRDRVTGSIIDFPDHDHDLDGFIAGGQIGCNFWQGDRWVFGIEGQASWADFDNGRDFAGPFTTGDVMHFRTENNVIGSIAARFGYAFGATGQTLWFVKGGAAFAHHGHVAHINTGGATFVIHETDKDLRWGWMVGTGIEQALSGNWSIKAEYNFNHFQRRDFDLCLGGVCESFDAKHHMHVVKVGINYRFGGFGGPVVARY
jgi:outer membrane immunogenic protein